MSNIVNSWQDLVNNFSKQLEENQRLMTKMSEKNNNLLSALCSIKIKLEKSLKNPSTLNDAVYDSINLSRSLTPYSKNYGEQYTVDPPLTDEEKTLPSIS